MKHLFLLLSFITIYFSASSQAPTITSFSPSSGPVGTLVTVTGTNLNNPTAFTIGGETAIVVSSNSTTLVGMIMPGALTGSVSVTTAGGTAMGSSNFTVSAALYPRAPQGPKLIGTGAVGMAVQGNSVAISADGNTAIVGGSEDSSRAGAVWVYTRTGTTWSQQGPKLVGTGAVGPAEQGGAVALSADGNTAIVGAGEDSDALGAAWIFTRSGATWSQQGSKLVGTNVNGPFCHQGWGVSISADGNTAIVGGCGDNNFTGAVWVYTRTGTNWFQQGAKLVGTGAVGQSYQGFSVALSADASTIIAGGYMDNSIGAAWIYTRTGATWSQQGGKLVGTGGVGPCFQGISVALSADGNTAAAGGDHDNNYIGAAWIYNRTGSVWSQQGNKLVGAGATGASGQGRSVSLSASGTVVIVGGLEDSSNVGAAWVYTRPVSTWVQQGSKLQGTGSVGPAYQGISAALSADGSTAVIGGEGDNNYIGAAWIYVSDSISTCMPTASALSQSICAGSSYSFGGSTLNTGGTYHDTLTNSGGCDSIVTLTLSVNTVSRDTAYQTICKGQSFSFGGHTLATAGNYHDTLTNSGGCDSIVTLSLSFTAAATSHLSDTLNQGGSIILGTHTYTQSGTYIDTIINTGGCDSIVILQLYVITGINDIKGPSTIHLYPNPNKGSFNLQTSASIGSDYTITDMLGHSISHHIRSDSQQIEMEDAAAGVYTLTVRGAQPIRFVVISGTN